MTDSEKKNKILELALKSEWGFGLHTITTEVLPGCTETEAIELLIQIKEVQPAVASVNMQLDSESIQTNGRTSAFLRKNNGFVGLADQNKKLEKQESDEYENLLLNTEVTKHQIKYKWLPYAISFLSLIVSLFAIIGKEDKPEPQLSKPEILSIIDSVLTSSHSKTDDSLYMATQKLDTLSSK